MRQWTYAFLLLAFIVGFLGFSSMAAEKASAAFKIAFYILIGVVLVSMFIIPPRQKP